MNQNTVKPTQEEKAAYMVTHWGQRVRRWYHSDMVSRVSQSYMSKYQVENGYLLLTPLSDITAEDAIEVAKIVYGKDDKLRFRVSMGYERNDGNCTHESVVCVEVSLFIAYLEDSRYYLYQLIQIDTEENDIVVGKFSNDGAELSDDHGDNILHAFDFLRSKGYALPWMGYSVQDLQDFGWLKLKQKGGSENG